MARWQRTTDPNEAPITTPTPTDPDAATAAPVPALLLRPRVRLALLVVVAVGASIGVAASGGLSQAGVRDLVDGSGLLGPLVYVVLYAVLTVAFVPGSVLTITAGVVFGPVVGTVLAVVGATIGATASFLVGRRVGRDGVEDLGAASVRRLDRFVTERGFTAILVARLVPLFPFTLLNYASGVTGVRTREYVLATAIGIIPASFAFAALGGSLDDPFSAQFLGALGLVVVLAVGGGWYARRARA